MTAEEAEDWLRVAVGEVLTYPANVLHYAAGEARRTCTHHSQIVPTIIREADEMLEQQRRVDRHPVVTPLPVSQRLPAPQLTQADVDAMPEKLRTIGLACGALIQDGEGNLRPAPRDTAA